MVSILMLFVLLSCILSLHAPVCTPMDLLEAGASLTPASQPLHSASSTFILSFRNPPSPSATHNSTSNLFLAISFLVNSSQLDYPAWVANRNTSVSASASLTLSSSGDLLLSDPSLSSSSPIWNSKTAGLGVVRAQLLDSGNLVLLNSRSDYVWQSFNYPTDTLLPGQNFNGNSTALTCNRKSGDFYSGRYSFDLETLVVQLNHTTDSLQILGSKIMGSIDSLQFDNLGNITLFSSSSSIISTKIANDHGVSGTRRMTLDMDGNLRMYTWDVDTAQWSGVWMLILSVCTEVPQVCGSYGVCTYNSIEPTCMCPQGFSVVDPNDLSSGCAANYKMADACSASVKYVEIQNVNFPFNDLANLSSVSIDECTQICLKMCNCLAVVYHKTAGQCWLKQALENGRVPMTQDLHVFLKISASDPLVSNPIEDTATKWSLGYLWEPSSNSTSVTYGGNSKYLSTIIALAVLIAIEGMCFAATVTAFITRSQRHVKSARLREELEGCPTVYSFEEVRVATKNFSHKLGEGGFGTVYKGQLPNGKCVAVKQLEGMLEQEKQFRAEITTIGRIHHVNLLRLVGFCSEGNHRLLVYEYMENGSLDQILFQGLREESSQVEELDWGTRFSICVGVARGIHYLHEECLNCILHCDIKPQNILLDRSYCAKVADFGLAYLHSRDHTVKMTTIRGTRGYLAPEWVSNLPITAKADVYSYGMLIMEIVSGRSNYLYTKSGLVEVGEKWCFPMWAYGKRIEEVVDARLEESSIDREEVERVVKLAFACMQADMNARPTMGQVLQMLEGVLPVPDAPPPSLL